MWFQLSLVRAAPGGGGNAESPRTPAPSAVEAATLEGLQQYLQQYPPGHYSHQGRPSWLVSTHSAQFRGLSVSLCSALCRLPYYLPAQRRGSLLTVLLAADRSTSVSLVFTRQQRNQAHSEWVPVCKNIVHASLHASTQLTRVASPVHRQGAAAVRDGAAAELSAAAGGGLSRAGRCDARLPRRRRAPGPRAARVAAAGRRRAVWCVKFDQDFRHAHLVCDLSDDRAPRSGFGVQERSCALVPPG